MTETLSPAAQAVLDQQPVSPPYKLPEPEGPTDQEIARFLADRYRERMDNQSAFGCPDFDGSKTKAAQIADARAVLARWGHQPARLRYCPTHGQQPPEAWGCPDCVRELREELAASLHPTPAVEGEVAELVKWLLREADYQEITCKRYPCADRIRRAAALLERFASPACLVINPSPEALAALKAAGPGIIEAMPAERTVLVPLPAPEGGEVQP